MRIGGDIFSFDGLNKLGYWLFMLLFAVITKSLHAANWNGTVISRFQADNRISNQTSFAGEVWGTLEYRDMDNGVYAAYNFLSRLSDLDHKTNGLYGFDSGYQTYQAFVQKTFDSLNTTLKAGRFQRSDNIGFYLLDGADIIYETENRWLTLNVYGGVPTRIEQLKSEKGESLFGFDAVLSQAPKWEGSFLPLSLDVFDLRFGYQRFENLTTAHRLTLGVNSEGRVLSDYLDKYEARFLGTYRIDKNLFEDLLVEIQLDVNKDFRLRTSYEYYDPDRFDFPTFRERFYNYFNQGDQAIFRGTADYRLFHDLIVSLGGLHSNREIGDSGYGINAGLELQHWPGNTLLLAGDYVELGEEKISSIWFGVKQVVNSRFSFQIDALARKEDKTLYGDNRVIGGEFRCDYMLQSDIVVSLDLNYIDNSRLEDEHLVRIQMTYYFDNFKPKAR